jgi:hypothetical protein
VRADAFRAEAARADALRAIEALPGIVRVSPNAQSGSLLIEYEVGLAVPEHICEAIAAAAGLAGVVDAATDPADRVPPARVLVSAVRGLNEVARELTGGRADLSDLVPAAMTAAAAYSFARSKHERMPRWDNLLWWSYGMFLDWHRRDVAKRARGTHAP